MWPMRLSVNKPKPVASALKGLVDDKPNFKVPVSNAGAWGSDGVLPSAPWQFTQSPA